MLLFAQHFSGYFCSCPDFQICYLKNSLGRKCTVNLFPPPQWAVVKSSSSQRLRTTHRGEDLTYGRPRWCLDGSPWYVWHTRSIILPCTWALNILWFQQQMGVCRTRTFFVLFAEGLELFSDQVAGGIQLYSGFREPVSYTSSSPSLRVL